VLLDALIDYGGTLIFVSHDRYFVERLATKIIDVGNGEAVVYPGTYKEFLWHKEHPEGQAGQAGNVGRVKQVGQVGRVGEKVPAGKKSPPVGRVLSDPAKHSDGAKRSDPPTAGGHKRARLAGAAEPERGSREEKKRADAEARKASRAEQARRVRIEDLEARIANCERAIREIEDAMAAPGFYEDRAAAQPVIERHQTLMWEVGDLMHQWESLQTDDVATATEH